MIDSKAKIVSFRLSESEFAEIENVSRANGYRSLSLFARSAILAFGSSAENSPSHRTEVSELRQRIDIMAAELTRLSTCVRAIISTQTPEDANS